jgi:hypothetical protein
MTQSGLGDMRRSAGPATALIATANPSAAATGAVRDLLPARTAAGRLGGETAALRREAAEIVRRSRWWRDECRRELLLQRRWYGAPAAPPRSSDP